jgi:hypothetical protein
MIVNETQICIGLLVGLMPYRVECQVLPGGKRTLEAQALFWSLRVHRRSRSRRNWTLRLPVIERIRGAAWAAVMRLRDDPLAQD